MELKKRQNMDLLMFSHGFMLTTGRAGYGDYGVIWLEVALGRELVNSLREILDEELYENIVDPRFSPHITIFHRNSLGDEEKAQLQESVAHEKLGCLVGEGITLRARKGNPGGAPAPLDIWHFFSKE